MYPATQTFWLEQTGEQEIGLRRYTRGSSAWTCEEGWHEAVIIIGTEPLVLDENRRMQVVEASTSREDPRWPTHCRRGCGYAFQNTDAWQDWRERLWRRTDTSEVTTLRQAPPGACWDASWMPEVYRGPDGVCLVVKCPNGHHWNVDSEASNCTRKGEPHQCWVRHGDPSECKVTVDKNGDTCAAGAGSILAGDYHGFLQAGVLTAG